MKKRTAALRGESVHSPSSEGAPELQAEQTLAQAEGALLKTTRTFSAFT